jgi:hypothetical protein
MSLDTGGPANTNGVTSVAELEGRVREKLEYITRAIADLQASGGRLDPSEVALLTDLLRNLAAAVDGAEGEALDEPSGAQQPAEARSPEAGAETEGPASASASAAGPGPGPGPGPISSAAAPPRPAPSAAAAPTGSAQAITPASRRRLRRRGR